jgi:uncharacterized protein (TIGR02145 family)
MKIATLAIVLITLFTRASAQQMGSFTDARDGKTYKTAIIGEQMWMAENLAYKPSSGSYWAANNNSSNVAKYGYLYDWQTAMNVCPMGWHLPSDTEWNELINFVETSSGEKLSAKSGWGENINGSDDFGFSALPGGYRYVDGAFNYVGEYGYWWSSTEHLADFAWHQGLANSKVFNRHTGKKSGFSVRCIKSDKSVGALNIKHSNIKNRWKGTHLNIENGLAVGEIAPGWQSAIWLFEPVEGTSYVRIKNHWKGTYLNVENGFGCTEIDPGWHSAMWELEPVEGTNYVRIKNRWKGTYVNIENGLNCTEIAPGWQSALWKIDYNVPE